jgi:hypothetical protein
VCTENTTDSKSQAEPTRPSKCNSSKEQVEARVSGQGEHLDGHPGHMLIFGQAYLLQAPVHSVGDSIGVLARKPSIAVTQLLIRLEGMDDNKRQSKKMGKGGVIGASV